MQRTVLPDAERRSQGRDQGPGGASTINRSYSYPPKCRKQYAFGIQLLTCPMSHRKSGLGTQQYQGCGSMFSLRDRM